MKQSPGCSREIATPCGLAMTFGVSKGAEFRDDPSGADLRRFAKSVKIPLTGGLFEELIVVGFHHGSPDAAKAALWVFTACVQRAPTEVPAECVLYLGAVGVPHSDPQRARLSAEALYQVAFFAPEMIGLPELVQIYRRGVASQRDKALIQLIGEFLCFVASKSPQLKTAKQAIRLLETLSREVSAKALKEYLFGCIQEVIRLTIHQSLSDTLLARYMDTIERKLTP